MTSTRHTLFELFYNLNQNKRKRSYSAEWELNEPFTLNNFYTFMIERYNICSDRANLDEERLDALYKCYTDTFYRNKGHFFETLARRYPNGCIYMPSESVFGNMLPTVKCVTNIDYFVNRCYKNPEEMLRNRQNQVSLDAYIRKYGEDKGREMFGMYQSHRKELYEAKGDSFKEECASRMRRNAKSCKEHYIGRINSETGNIYTEDEIVKAISEHQHEMSRRSANKLKARNSKYHDITCRQVNYWMRKGFTYDESVQRVKAVQATNTIETYIKKYGYEMGIEAYNARNKKWGESMRTLKSQSGKVGCAYSKASVKLFDTVLQRLSDAGVVFDKVYYGDKEFSKWDSEFNRVYFYDFVINDIMLCVEYNGIMFHPKFGDYGWKGLFSSKGYDEVYSYDMQKQNLIRKCGYELIVVWEDDVFEKSVEKIVNVCLELVKRLKNN